MLGGLICSLKSFLQLNICQKLHIFAVVCMYSGASYVLLDFVIVTLELLPVDDVTIGITCAAFCFHMAHISFASSWYLFCLSVTVWEGGLCVFGTAVCIKKVFIVFLFIKVMSGPLKCIFLSVSMLRFQYSLKFSFSSTLAAEYL